ncbi:MAG: hypothetical protein IMF19_04655 [Proteobacteria bacterium]|nr:hypothetical protein [Pseudomonadota bacterium]
MKDNDPWSIEKYVTAAIAFVVTAFIFTIGSCGLHTDYRIAKAIEQGNDPILSRLAFSDDGCDERLLYIANKEK